MIKEFEKIADRVSGTLNRLYTIYSIKQKEKKEKDILIKNADLRQIRFLIKVLRSKKNKEDADKFVAAHTLDS